jgi:hypothetical protein
MLEKGKTGGSFLSLISGFLFLLFTLLLFCGFGFAGGFRFRCLRDRRLGGCRVIMLGLGMGRLDSAVISGIPAASLEMER